MKGYKQEMYHTLPLRQRVEPLLAVLEEKAGDDGVRSSDKWSIHSS